MKSAFQYRPRFVDIRVRPPKDEETASAEGAAQPKAGERACDSQGCLRPAVTRAPKSRDLLSDHYWFCQAHAAEYNRTWNFFAGMSEAETSARIADELATGGRPTWSFKGGARNREASFQRGFFRDAFGLFGAGKARADEDRVAFDRRLGRLERAALIDLGLTASADSSAIRRSYIALVKLCHPDANGGDRTAEHKLQRVIRAYKTLRKARLV